MLFKKKKIKNFILKRKLLKFKKYTLTLKSNKIFNSYYKSLVKIRSKLLFLKTRFQWNINAPWKIHRKKEFDALNKKFKIFRSILPKLYLGNVKSGLINVNKFKTNNYYLKHSIIKYKLKNQKKKFKFINQKKKFIIYNKKVKKIFLKLPRKWKVRKLIIKKKDILIPIINKIKNKQISYYPVSKIKKKSSLWWNSKLLKLKTFRKFLKKRYKKKYWRFKFGYFTGTFKKTKTNFFITIMDKKGNVLVKESCGTCGIKTTKISKSFDGLKEVAKRAAKKAVGKNIRFLYKFYITHNYLKNFRIMSYLFRKSGLWIFLPVFVRKRKHSLPMRKKKIRRL